MLRTAFAVYAVVFAIALAALVGTPLCLPFLLLPRGRRERFAIFGNAVWSHLVLRVVLFARPIVQGREHVPKTGPYLVVANHRSWIDIPMNVRYLRAQGVSKNLVRWLPFIGWYGYLGGAIFFDRNDPNARKRVLAEAARAWQNGVSLHVYPEGTRTRTGRLRSRIHLRLVEHALASGVPVVPVALWHTELSVPPRGFRAKPGQTVYMRIGAPIRREDHESPEAGARAAWESIRAQLRELGGDADWTPDAPSEASSAPPVSPL